MHYFESVYSSPFYASFATTQPLITFIDGLTRNNAEKYFVDMENSSPVSNLFCFRGI